MASDPKLKPHKVTKPIQLLAAWLVGLVFVNGSFLAAASTIKQPTWIPAMLAIAAVLNVPVFLIAIFILQTRYRPEMQEDSYYHQYLNSKTGNSPIRPAPTALVTWTSTEESVLASKEDFVDFTEEDQSKYRATAQHRWGKAKVAVNKLRPDLLEILAVLKDNGIPFSETFGSDAKEAPPYFQIAAGYNVGVAEVKLVVLAFAHYKEGRISLIAAHEEPNELSDTILIGSYGRPSGPRLVDAYEILDKGLMSDAEFLDYLRQGEDSY